MVVTRHWLPGKRTSQRGAKSFNLLESREMEWLSVQSVGSSNAGVSVICCVTFSKLLTVSVHYFSIT